MKASRIISVWNEGHLWIVYSNIDNSEIGAYRSYEEAKKACQQFAKKIKKEQQVNV